MQCKGSIEANSSAGLWGAWNIPFPSLRQNSFPPSVPAFTCVIFSFSYLLPPQLDWEPLTGKTLLGLCTLAPTLWQGACPGVGLPQL